MSYGTWGSKLATIVASLSCLGQADTKAVRVGAEASEKLILPTIATFSQASGCIYVQHGRDEDGHVVATDQQVCGIDFLFVIPATKGERQ